MACFFIFLPLLLLQFSPFLSSLPPSVSVFPISLPSLVQFFPSSLAFLFPIWQAWRPSLPPAFPTFLSSLFQGPFAFLSFRVLVVPISITFPISLAPISLLSPSFQHPSWLGQWLFAFLGIASPALFAVICQLLCVVSLPFLATFSDLLAATTILSEFEFHTSDILVPVLLSLCLSSVCQLMRARGRGFLLWPRSCCCGTFQPVSPSVCLGSDTETSCKSTPRIVEHTFLHRLRKYHLSV